MSALKLCSTLLLFGLLCAVNSDQDGSAEELIERLILSGYAPDKDRDPCAKPTIPDYRSPNRRISETKCLEYQWLFKEQREDIIRNTQCFIKLFLDGGVRENLEKGVEITNSDKKSSNLEGMTENANKRQEMETLSKEITESGTKNTKKIHKRQTLVDINVFAQMGAVGWLTKTGSWIFYCGSILISTNFVLTAAHCSKTALKNVADPEPKIIRLGDYTIGDVDDSDRPFWRRLNVDYLDRYRGRVDAKIKRIIVHPSYASPKKYFDIALMELDEHLAFNSVIQPACLWHKYDVNNLTNSTIAGWGVTENGTTSSYLLYGHLEIVDSQNCDNILADRCNRNWCGLDDHQLCAADLEFKQDTCSGDSGGPIQVPLKVSETDDTWMYYVVGVTSFGFGCLNSGLPGIYTRVSPFLDWIEPIVWPELS